MTFSNDSTTQSADTLRNRVLELASTMTRTAESLQRGESVELQYISDEINAVQQLMSSLKEKLDQHPLLAVTERNAQRMTDIIDACREIDVRQLVLDKLKRIELVKSYDDADREGFDRLANQVHTMIETLNSGAQEERKKVVELFQSHESPYLALHEMINRPEELSDDRWLENQRLINDAFGRSVALAVLRGRAR